jgi:hypothetical protein
MNENSFEPTSFSFSDISAAILIIVLNVVMFGIPVWKIVRRAGFSGWWSLLLLGGPFMVVGLWLFAVRPWPAVDQRT